MKTLFDKTRLSNMHLKNRFFRSATWEAMADLEATLILETEPYYVHQR